jgi:hypothetical protein
VAATIALIAYWWPRISIEPSAAADVANPLSTIFRITNDQGYSLEDLSVEVSLRCFTLGRGDPPPMAKCLPSMHTSASRWENHALGPHEPYDINPGEKLWATPGRLLSAQLDFFVSFQPWKIPYRFTMPFRFESRRLADGTLQWLRIPSD